MQQFILALALLSTFVVSSQIVTIPDTNFKNILLNHNPVIDTNSDGEIQVSEASDFNENLSISDNVNIITDLTGIESFVNIISIYLTDTDVTSLDLSFATSLEIALVISNTFLEEIDISLNSSLKDVQFIDNPLNVLDLSNNPNIDQLWSSGGNLTTLDVGNKPLLFSLFVQHNNLTEIDVSQCPLLEHFICNSNNLNSLDLSSNPIIKTVRAHVNDIETIDFTNNPLLEIFTCRGNLLTDLNMSLNPNLRELYCQENNISSLDLSENGMLEELWFNGNQMELLDVRNGNNVVLTEFYGVDNSSTLCIEVDDAVMANAGTGVYADWIKDFSASYSENCQLGISELSNAEMMIYPSPTTDILNIQSEVLIASIEIFDVLGQSLVLLSDPSNNEKLDISSLSSGNYFVRISTVDSSSVYQIIKE